MTYSKLPSETIYASLHAKPHEFTTGLLKTLKYWYFSNFDAFHSNLKVLTVQGLRDFLDFKQALVLLIKEISIDNPNILQETFSIITQSPLKL